MSSGGGLALPWFDTHHRRHLGLPLGLPHRAHPGPDNGLGSGGEALHTWALSEGLDNRWVLREGTALSPAVVLGRRLFDVVDGPKGTGWHSSRWNSRRGQS